MRDLSKRIIIIFGLMLVSAIGMTVSAAPTAEEIAKKASAVVTNANGLSATFQMKINGQTISGSIKSQGVKFMVSVPQLKTWYNGKLMYTYNAKTKETTLITPTSSDIMESNPLMYVYTGGKSYKYSFSNNKVKGKYVIDLTPNNTKTGIKKITLTINSTNYHVERIVASTKSGNIDITVNSLKTGSVVKSSDFEYPLSQYPNTEIIDLR